VTASKRALLLVGHGSKRPGFQTAMERIAAGLRLDGEFDFVECAYLEIAPPSIGDAVDALVARGALEIRVVPYFLQTGRHVVEDIPAAVSLLATRHVASARVVLCPYLGYDDRIADVVKERSRQIHE
jgi:sirohydrochlorin cobaltochelatase